MNADEMFEKLGTNKIDNIDFCVYEGKNVKSNRILFNKVRKSIIFEGFNAFGMQELQAIYKKCEELAWIDKNIKELR